MDVVETVKHKSDGGGCDVVVAAAEVRMSVSVLAVENVEAVNRGHPLGRADGSQHGTF
jgi:hypothetical protein